MTNRQFFTNTSLGETTQTDTAEHTKLSLTFTPDASSDYILIWRASIRCSSTAAVVHGRFYDDDGTTLLNEQVGTTTGQMRSTGEYMAIGGIFKKSYGASPGSKTYDIRYKQDSATTIGIKDASIIAIKLTADDQYAEDNSDTSQSSTTQADKAVLTFTPATTGDYCVIWMGEGAQTITGFGRMTSVIDGVNKSQSSNDFGLSITAWQFWNYVQKVNLTNASHTIKVQISTNGSGTMHGRNTRIVALRMDGFTASYYGESLTRSTTTSSTYQDKATVTFTPNAAMHLILAGGIVDSSSTTVGATAKFLRDSTDADIVTYVNNGGAGEENPNFTAHVSNLAASSHTFKTQWRSDDGVVTAALGNSAIAVLELGPAPTLTPGLVVDTDVFYTPSLPLHASLFNDTDTFYSPSVGFGRSNIQFFFMM